MKRIDDAAIVAGLVEEMERGVVPWRRPWSDDDETRPRRPPRNVVTGHSYSGVNILLLWQAAAEKGFSTDDWVTFVGAREFGGVRKGEKATQIVRPYEEIHEDDEVRIAAGEITREQARRDLKFGKMSIFNVEQTRDGLSVSKGAGRPLDERQQAAIDWIGSVGADIRHGKSAYYSHILDQVHLPSMGRFHTPSDYVGTALHELGHWTGHPTRLDRPFARGVDMELYAREELIAELNSAILCSRLGVRPTSGHKDYLGYWTSAIGKDPKFLLRSASQASEAVEYLAQAATPSLFAPAIDQD